MMSRMQHTCQGMTVACCGPVAVSVVCALTGHTVRVVRTSYIRASEKAGYGKMNAFAAFMLRKLQQGLY